MVLLFFHRPRTETANVNPKELYWSVVFSFGHAFTTNVFDSVAAFITNSNEVCYDK